MEAANFVGVDVSTERLDVGLWPNGQTFDDSNDAKGISRLGERIAKLKPQLVVLESTGRLEVPLALELQERGVPYRIASSTRARCASSHAPWASWPKPIARPGA